MKLAISVSGGNDLWIAPLSNGVVGLMTETASAEVKLFESWWNRKCAKARSLRRNGVFRRCFRFIKSASFAPSCRNSGSLSPDTSHSPTHSWATPVIDEVKVWQRGTFLESSKGSAADASEDGQHQSRFQGRDHTPSDTVSQSKTQLDISRPSLGGYL